MGAHLMENVLLRNPDIDQRCDKPEHFDRLGRLHSAYLDADQHHPDELYMMQHLSLNEPLQ